MFIWLPLSMIKGRGFSEHFGEPADISNRNNHWRK